MDELRARSFGEGSASGGAAKKKAKKNTKKGASFNGVLTLTASEFARFEECMNNPGEPTAASQQGAEMLRRLYKNR
jgi:hypothetical protein